MAILHFDPVPPQVKVVLEVFFFAEILSLVLVISFLIMDHVELKIY